jgi:hypothetical protein
MGANNVNSNDCVTACSTANSTFQIDSWLKIYLACTKHPMIKIVEVKWPIHSIKIHATKPNKVL